MSPRRRDEPSVVSQVVQILLILLVVFGLGALYFRLTGSVL